MDHFFGQLSLLHGWLPPTAQGVTLLLIVAAIQWRKRRWLKRVLPAALAAAVAVTALAYRYIASLGVAGDPAPTSLWLWIAMSGLAVAVLVLGWVGVRWWRRAVAFVSIPSVRCARAWHSTSGWATSPRRSPPGTS